jgi:hypothetical protein
MAHLKIVEESEAVMEDVEAMKHIELSRPEQLLLAEFGMKARFDLDEEEESSAVVPYQPSDFLRVRRWEDRKDDLYTSFNTVQENVVKGGVSRRDSKGKKHTTREIKGIDQSVRLNRMLWAFTQRMKELKG